MIIITHMYINFLSYRFLDRISKNEVNTINSKQKKQSQILSIFAFSAKSICFISSNNHHSCDGRPLLMNLSNLLYFIL